MPSLANIMEGHPIGPVVIPEVQGATDGVVPPTHRECYAEAAAALRRLDIDTARAWRELGDSILVMVARR